MKKTIASTVFVMLFAIYAIAQRMSSASDTYVATSTTTAQQITQTQTTPVVATQTATQASQSPTKTTASSGQYKDGTYAGSAESAYYGTVQVQAIISGGKLTDIQFLQLPGDRNTSKTINQNAMRGLVQQAIATQSANVSGVSGATDTTAAFRQSLQTALTAAQA